MSTEIKCPHCGQQFEASEAFKKEVQDQLNIKADEWKKKKDQEFEEKSLQLNKKIESLEKASQEKELEMANKIKNALKDQEEQTRKKIAEENNAKFLSLQEQLTEAKLKSQQLEQSQLDVLRLQNQIEENKRNAEVEKQKYLLENKAIIIEEALSKEKINHDLQKKEWELKVESAMKQVEEMKRKLEQGSMQTQGEAQELLLESLLQTTFPFDTIEEVGKGVRGADCIQTVRNKLGNECGRIIFESKRTKDFQNEWIEKLKTDMRSLGADVAVIVTQALPKDMERFGEKNGVYICTFAEVRSVAMLLRDAIIKIADAKKSQENKGDKMVMLYDYLTGSEFSENWKAIREGFMSMKLSIQREREAMEKLWKAREKQLEKVLLNAAHIKGSVEGIAGSDAVNLDLLEDNETLLIE